jgi:hypothetical protein
VTGTSVTYQWSPVDNATDYKLMVSTSTNIMDTTKRKISILVGNVTTYVDTGYPANGTKYYWWVWAINADGGQSLWSEVSANGRWITNTSTYIAAPALLSPVGVAVPGTSVTFEWSPVAGAANYRLMVSTSTNPMDTTKRKISVLVGNVTTYVDTGYPANGTTYYWWVWAYVDDGSQSVWAEVSANMRSFTSVA